MQVADAVLPQLNLIYPAAYLLARSIVGPPAVLWICKELWKAEKIPDAYKCAVICTTCDAGRTHPQLKMDCCDMQVHMDSNMHLELGWQPALELQLGAESVRGAESEGGEGCSCSR